MHAVAIGKSLLEEHPWLAQATFVALPWYGRELENARRPVPFLVFSRE